MSGTTGILNQAPDVYEYKPEPMLHKELVQGLTRWERFIRKRSVDFEFEPGELVFFMHDNKVYGRHITSRFIPYDSFEYHYNIMNIGTFTKKTII